MEPCKLRFTPVSHQGFTYPGWLENAVVYALWKQYFCPQGWHLWDEVQNSQKAHVLVCDAGCGATFGHRGEE